MAVSKVSYNGTTLIDLTDTTATAADVASGKYFYAVNGVRTAGTGSGGVFIVDVVWNSVSETHELSKTYSQIMTALNNGDTIVLQPYYQPPHTLAAWKYEAYDDSFHYYVHVDDMGKVMTYHYILDANGQTLDSVTPFYDTSDANAQASEVLAGKGFYNSLGYDEGTIPTKTSSDLTASGATVTVPSGYYASNATKTISSGSATPASSISGTSATVSTGTNTLTLSKTVSNTPQVSAGYISSGTAGNSSVSLTASVTTKAAATITPSTSNQTIASGTYLTGTQTISGDANLVAGNIKSGTSIFGVTGTYSGGASGVAKGTLTVASNVNTSTSTQITTTTAIGFTPKCFLFYRSDRSATSNHVNQASFVTLGSSYYVRTMTRYSSNALSTSGNTNNWTTQTAGYLYFNSNTIYFRSSSSYILPSGTWYWVAIE